MIFDAHTHRVDEYRQQNGALKVAVINDKFEPTPQRPQTDAACRHTVEMHERLNLELELSNLTIN